MTYRKKLIEVSLPLPEINDASAYDKMPGIGPHPKGIHHWWARLPLPTARAVLFASVVDDPDAHPEQFPTESDRNIERERLFDILRRMMSKKLHESPDVYAEAQSEMLKYCDGNLPTVLDPFAGGGSIPLEANRLGFKVRASDLNPVAILLNKCNLELAPRWLNYPPVNPVDKGNILPKEYWRNTLGLSADLRYYGNLIYKKAISNIGHLYPKIKLPETYGKSDTNVIAWVWARTVASPNPLVSGKQVPLISTYWLSSKGKMAWLEPIIDKSNNTYHFEVKTGKPKDTKHISAGTKMGRGGFRCLLTDTPITFEYIREQGKQNKLGFVMLAVVAEVSRGRTYLNVTEDQVTAAQVVDPYDYPDTDLPDQALGFRVQNYGIRKHYQMFTKRQLTTMVELSKLVKESKQEIHQDCISAGLSFDEADVYANTIVTFLALSIDRCASFNNSLCNWNPGNQKVMHIFGRGAIPMVWDFAEANFMSNTVGSWDTCLNYVADCVEVLTAGSSQIGEAVQSDAVNSVNDLSNLLVSTDPPYYDNIGYAALSDFFYIWLRHVIGDLYPSLFNTVLVPKMPELTASPERFGGDREKAKEHFESGFRQTFTALHSKINLNYPVTVYYAFKQDDENSGIEQNNEEVSSIDLTTGWETLLEALISSGFQITATWPVRASQQWRIRAIGSNALASYIILACRPRPQDAPSCSRREFLSALKKEIAPALRELKQGNIAPVDLAQASIGPGMAIYSHYSAVLESDGKSMSVRTALGLINKALDTYLTEQEGEYDSDTRWALTWFEQYGHNEAAYGEAETLSRAKNTSVEGLSEAGIVEARGGKVRLYRREELDTDWDPAQDKRLTAWESAAHLIYALENSGEESAAELLAKLGSVAEVARDLAYRLYTVCERKGWAQDALGYNMLVVAWPRLKELAARQSTKQENLL